MPRDLGAVAKEKALNDMPELTKSPEDMDERQKRRAPMDAEDDMPQGSLFSQMVQNNDKRDELHPYTQTLTISDVESCTRLEEEAFPPNERATREKFQYRLQTCGSLCMGLYTSSSNPSSIPTASTATPVYSGAPSRKAVLLAHIVATKSTHPTVTDADMSIPATYPASFSGVGHNEAGRTVCIQSLAVLPQYQRRGLGTTLMKAYLQRMESHAIGDRVALLAHEGMVGFYEGLGFVRQGESEASFGGGGWVDMVRELKEGSDESEEDDDDDDDE
ncbi:uncharacterized protein LTR77_007916 [Saxophila tyrrhenica]|uniref:N-acetyltransferase domain-containing protein n=1 Tax=Saxophila tyrrhenica TaxID=1690608 RepID=A0AAV9P6B4_9PEZI|nr:hypothetical protein LTR77_007916 [Saxophila tyrrhenica]